MVYVSTNQNSSISKTYTVSTRLIKTDEFLDYFEPLLAKYSKILRLAFKDVQRYPIKDLKSKNGYQAKFNIDARTANSILRTAKGLVNSHEELKKYELSQLKFKVKNLEYTINSEKRNINSLKKLATENSLSYFQLKSYKKLKQNLYLLCQKLNRLNQKVDKLRSYIQSKNFSMCFGTKKLFRKQHLLKENNYPTHEKWLNTFRKNRDKYITYLGSKGEPNCNQNFQIVYNEETDSFDIKIRKDLEYMENENDKYFYIRNVDIPYQKEIIKDILEYKTSSLTYRIIRKDKKYYVQIMFTLSIEDNSYSTTTTNGTIGLDYNKGFIQLCETNKEGNIIKFNKVKLNCHGTGNKAKTGMEQKISKIVHYASEKKKTIIIEDLNFGKKKSQVNKSVRDKKYNKMIHVFDYSRYMETIENTSFRKRVKVEKINPYKTSIIGDSKYSKTKGINRHQAASYVIARKGQGFNDDE